MHMIECVIRPSALDAVKANLASEGIAGVTALECKGFGKQKGHTERYRGARMDVGFLPKILLKIAVNEEFLDKAINAVVSAARTDKVGDGKLFIYPLAKVIRVRTGEQDREAL